MAGAAGVPGTLAAAFCLRRPHCLLPRKLVDLHCIAHLCRDAPEAGRSTPAGQGTSALTTGGPSRTSASRRAARRTAARTATSAIPPPPSAGPRCASAVQPPSLTAALALPGPVVSSPPPPPAVQGCLADGCLQGYRCDQATTRCEPTVRGSAALSGLAGGHSWLPGWEASPLGTLRARQRYPPGTTCDRAA